MSDDNRADDKKPAADEREPKSVYRDYLETILICVIFVIFSRAFIFQQSKIPSGSMKGTLEIGDYIMVNRFVYGTGSSGLERRLLPQRTVQRGDVVVFKYPRGPETDYIKRVVGLPGDVIRGHAGRVWVNSGCGEADPRDCELGEPLDEPYVFIEQGELFRRRATRDFDAERVAPEHYFVMGDHRCHSEDSRFWGQVPHANMKGRALLIWWSYPEESTPNGYMTVGQRLRSWGEKVVHFVTRSRWERCFKLIR